MGGGCLGFTVVPLGVFTRNGEGLFFGMVNSLLQLAHLTHILSRSLLTCFFYTGDIISFFLSTGSSQLGCSSYAVNPRSIASVPRTFLFSDHGLLHTIS